jgi:hypothetical protein
MTSSGLPFAAAVIVLVSLTMCIYVFYFKSGLFVVCSKFLYSAPRESWLFTHSEMRRLLYDDDGATKTAAFDRKPTSDVSTDWRYLNMIRSLMTRHDPSVHRRLINNTRRHFSEVARVG